MKTKTTWLDRKIAELRRLQQAPPPPAEGWEKWMIRRFCEAMRPE